MTTDHEFDDVVGAYALGALDADERAAFEAHLRGCVRCQQDLAQYRRVVTAIGAGVEPTAIPESLKARTLTRVTQRGAPGSTVGVPREAREVRSAWSWLQVAAVLLVGILGAYVVSLRSTLNALHEELAAITSQANSLRQELATLRTQQMQMASTLEVLGATDLVRVELRGTSPAVVATGRAYVSREEGLVFTATGLPSLAEGRVYQLWVIPPGAAAPISAGLLVPDASGAANAILPLPAGVTSVGTVAVTNEPGPSGSPGPTTSPFLAGTAGG
jgi:anti-sigma-K factor RskA